VGARRRLNRVRRIIQQSADLQGRFQVSTLVSRDVRRVRLLLQLRKFVNRACAVVSANAQQQ
jgi:hypothetical protein